MSHRFVVVMVM